MARRKKSKNETAEEGYARRVLEEISNVANRSEKTSWNRKLNKMVKLISNVRPLENQILDLIEQKTPLLDDISSLRQQMIRECIHPFDHLVLHKTHVECKFCNKLISIPRDLNDKIQT